MPGLSSYSYEARLALLELESLETRHIKADLAYVYKIVFHFVHIDPIIFSVWLVTTVQQEVMPISYI